MGKPLVILMIEDNPGDVRLAKEALHEGPSQKDIHVAQDGETALDFLHRRGSFANSPRPDLILMDFNLPRKGGRQLLEELKKDPGLCSIPVVVLSTSRADSDVVSAYDLHANCYIQKPVDLDHFWSVMQAVEQFWLSDVTLPPADA